MICPTCKGEKRVGALGYNYDRGYCIPVTLPCQDCSSGEVDDRYPHWKKQGDILKEARIARRETLRALCKRTGVDPMLRGMQERGFADPAGVEP